MVGDSVPYRKRSGESISENSASNVFSRRSFITAAGAGGIAALTGCLGGGNGDSGATAGNPGNKQVTIVYSTAPLFGKIKDKLAKSMHDAGLPDHINIKFNTTVWGAQDLQKRYQQILSSGRTTPDVFLSHASYRPYFVPRGWMFDLKQVLSESKLKELRTDYQQTFVDAYRYKDGLYGIPLFIDIPTIMYRKDLVSKAGHDPSGWETDPMKWKQFSHMIKDTKKAGNVKYGFADALQTRALYFSFHELWGTWGGNWYGDTKYNDGPIGERPITVNDEPTKNTLRMLRTFIYGQKDSHSLDGMAGNIIPRNALGWDVSPSLGPMKNGDAVAHRNWSFAIKDLHKKFGDDLGVMMFPYAVPESKTKYKGVGGSEAAMGGWHHSINPNTEHLDAAAEVLKAMATDKYYLDIFKYAGSPPPKPGLLKSKKAKQVKGMGPYVDTLRQQAQEMVIFPIHRAWEPQRQAITSQFTKCLKQNKSPQKACQTAQKQTEKIEQQFAKKQ
jgi:ABC-type glycerol-3-phosphate transport system substrate-binding protein